MATATAPCRSPRVRKGCATRISRSCHWPSGAHSRLTSNRTRELHDALERRCLFHWINYPAFERGVEIVRLRAPEVSGQLARQVVEAVELMREMHLVKRPGVAETLDWARALEYLGADGLSQELLEQTAGVVAKERDDVAKVSKSLSGLLRRGS